MNLNIKGALMSIITNLSEDGKILTIAMQGRFDFSSLQEFKDAYEKITPKPDQFIIDLKESEYLDSSALGMLLALREYAGEDRANLRITNCNEDIKKILHITKLDELFSVN